MTLQQRYSDNNVIEYNIEEHKSLTLTYQKIYKTYIVHYYYKHGDYADEWKFEGPMSAVLEWIEEFLTHSDSYKELTNKDSDQILICNKCRYYSITIREAMEHAREHSQPLIKSANKS